MHMYAANVASHMWPPITTQSRPSVLGIAWERQMDLNGRCITVRTQDKQYWWFGVRGWATLWPGQWPFAYCLANLLTFGAEFIGIWLKHTFKPIRYIKHRRLCRPETDRIGKAQGKRTPNNKQEGRPNERERTKKKMKANSQRIN